MRISSFIIWLYFFNDFLFDMFPSYLDIPKGYKRHRKAFNVNFQSSAKTYFQVKSNRRLMDSRSGKRYVKRKKNQKQSYQFPKQSNYSSRPSTENKFSIPLVRINKDKSHRDKGVN